MKNKQEIEELAEEFLTFHQYDTLYFRLKIREAIEFAYNKCQQDMADTSKVTRFEVIDENGRVYTQKDCKVELSYQDDDRTLKVFIKKQV
jgi:hypothetical protein